MGCSTLSQSQAEMKRVIPAPIKRWKHKHKSEMRDFEQGVSVKFTRPQGVTSLPALRAPTPSPASV